MEMGGSNYLVFTPDGTAVGLESIRYQKGRTHRVTAKGLWDLECDCPDYEYNGELNMGWCKHLMAVMAYRGHTPVLVKTLADASDDDQETAEAHRRDYVIPLTGIPPAYDPELERRIGELY